MLHLISPSGLGDLICFVAYGLLGAHFLVRLRRRQLPLTGLALVFLFAVTATAAWSAISLDDRGRHWSDSQPTWWLPSLDLLQGGLWLIFTVMLLGPSGRSGVLRWVLPLVGLLLVMRAVFIAAAEMWPTMDAARMFSLVTLLQSALGLVLVEQVLRNAQADIRWNVKPASLGLGAIFLFDLVIASQAALFQRFDQDSLSVRSLVHAVAAPLLFLSSRRHADWLGKVHVSRAAVFHSAALVLVGGYLLFVAAIGYYVRYTGGQWGRALAVALVFVALLLLAFVLGSGAVRSRLRVYISKNFFSYRYDYREEWLRFTALLASNSDPRDMPVTVIRALANLVESPSGMLWLQRGLGGQFAQVAAWNMPVQMCEEDRQGSLAQFWMRQGWVIDIDEWRGDPGSYPDLTLPDWVLAAPQCWLLLPLQTGGEFVGFVVLGRPRAAVELNWEVRDLLRTAASQAASYLNQVQATEALLEARKFDAFNRMSAFVVHDLKNIVTQLSLMMKNAKRLRDNPEFQQDMLDTVENSLEKMRQLMLQLREGDKPHGVVSGVDLEAIARRLAAAAASKGRVLELVLDASVSTRGHPERVERVLGHIVQNAMDATPADGFVRLRLDSEGSQARVRVEDSGCGMSEDFIQHRLFKPFQTTKSNGMGIGAHESYQYVQELGGKITVQSELNKGTAVTVLLPLFHANADASLVMQGNQ